MFGGQKLKRIVWNCKCDIIVRIGFHIGDTQHPIFVGTYIKHVKSSTTNIHLPKLMIENGKGKFYWHDAIK